MEEYNDTSMIVASCEDLKNKLVQLLSDVVTATECIRPLNAEDKKILEQGIDAVNQYIDKLKHKNTPRELNELIDVDKYLDEYSVYDEEISKQTAYQAYTQFMNVLENMCE